MQKTNSIVITANRDVVELDIRTILYIFMQENIAEVHVSGGKVYKTRMTLETLEAMLGDGFIKTHRSYLVSVMAIYDITDKIHLNNGETLNYVVRKKKEIVAEMRRKKESIIKSFSEDSLPKSAEKYHAQYESFDQLPIAFTVIEILYDENHNAADWIFRYGNQALANLEKLPLEQIVGNSFSSLFPNMDTKWLRSYERAALFGETLRIVDYSPEVDTYLDVICFPAGEGLCGCLMFDLSEVEYAGNSEDARNAKLRYIARLLDKLP